MGWRMRTKFNNIRTEIDKIKFSSKREARFYEELKLKKLAGEVAFFLMQVPLHFASGIRYVVDFLVFNADGTIRWIEVKGYPTPVWKMKMRMMAQEYPLIDIEVVK